MRNIVVEMIDVRPRLNYILVSYGGLDGRPKINLLLKCMSNRIFILIKAIILPYTI